MTTTTWTTLQLILSAVVVCGALLTRGGSDLVGVLMILSGSASIVVGLRAMAVTRRVERQHAALEAGDAPTHER
ncbi:MULTISPECIES: hypothetical protein [unclassified Frigoribacterium]|uniref:hypothetical protein n=1 Tax=unclassified Frigoribacterium TaxID=2627005 RepID=UPI00156432BF|nr:MULTISPECIES: hypothetical protein [unclassified Frigoribacterium]NQW87699.1 hypothetical protein [Frigoribacterium sp. VKM Ac-2860]NQX09492.1 hypothetical protein [Frigoribacterium sp. VKM Ac-2859]